METVLARFKKYSQESPDSIALITDEKSVTYNELMISITKLQNWLLDQKVRKGDMVPLVMTPSPELIVSIFALFSIGAGYVPIAASSPNSRIKTILNQLDSELVLTNLDNLIVGTKNRFEFITYEKIDKLAFSDFVELKQEKENLAYMIFTSGSTGAPKGVVANQGNLNYILDNIQEKMPVHIGDVYLLGTPIGFDVSITELMGWIHGGSLYISDLETKKNFYNFSNKVNQYNVTHIAMSPSALKILKDEDLQKMNSSVKYLAVGGEEFPVELSKRLKETMNKARIFNSYGPTEASVYAAMYEVTGEEKGKVPIGLPLAGAQVELRHPRIITVGEYGDVTAAELVIHGKGVTDGYWKNMEKTKQAFVNQVEGKSYKTGDLVFEDENQNLVYIGRGDQQIQIHGIRVEPEEIRTAALQISKKITDFEVAYDNNRLYGFAVLKPGSDISLEYIKSMLSNNIPSYMIPSKIVILDKMPLTLNGKVDKKQLLLMLSDNSNVFENYNYENSDKKKIASLISQIMGLSYLVPPSYNVFENGADSLNTVEITILLGELSGHEIGYDFVSSHPTIEKMFVALFEEPMSNENNVTESNNKKHYQLEQIKTIADDIIEESFVTYQNSLLSSKFSAVEATTFQRIYNTIGLNSYVNFDVTLESDDFEINQALSTLFLINSQLRVKFDLKNIKNAFLYEIKHNPVIIKDIRYYQGEVDLLVDEIVDNAKESLSTSDELFPSYLIALKTDKNQYRIVGVLGHTIADGATANIIKRQLITLIGHKIPQGTDFYKYQELLQEGSRLDENSKVAKKFLESMFHPNEPVNDEFIEKFPLLIQNKKGLSQEQIMLNSVEKITDIWLENSSSNTVSLMTIFSLRSLCNENFENLVGDVHTNVLLTRNRNENKLTFMNNIKAKFDEQSQKAFSANECVYWNYPNFNAYRQAVVENYERIGLNVNYIGEIDAKSFDEFMNMTSTVSELSVLNKQIRILSFSNNSRTGAIIVG